jgi:hypothetical protein
MFRKSIGEFVSEPFTVSVIPDDKLKELMDTKPG